MSMFSSRPQFNDDPMPMVDPFMGRRAEYADESLGWQLWPRTEYDRPQANPTNPYFLLLREEIGLNPSINPKFFIRELIEDMDLEDGFTGLEASQPARDHARRVLARLAAISSDK
ncbi:hypothetical protein [Microbacterium sp. LWH11-1.2]|uniref:hypothetical protein n=1 Tax=Microbacterium sp. LWH11-1.2 TaxID=3135258 RepID=UPI003138B81F